MSIQSGPYFWAVCDRCGVSATEGDDYTAWGDAEQASDQAYDSDWDCEGGNHLCYDCIPPSRDDGPDQ